MFFLKYNFIHHAYLTEALLCKLVASSGEDGNDELSVCFGTGGDND